jgi:Ca2+:H+ antiporter
VVSWWLRWWEMPLNAPRPSSWQQKTQLDLTLQISIGSAIQIAMFVAPILVIISVFFAKPMNLVFNSFELVAIILTVLMVNQVVGDGESNWFEGLQLILAHGIIAAAFFLYA